MQSEFKKGIEDLKKMKLTHAEKAGILKSVLNTPLASPYAPQRSFWMNFKILRSVSVAEAIVLFLFVVGGATAYNAESALPGEALYAVKVGLSEPVRDLLNITPADQAEWESIKAVRRLDEAADLAIEGKLNAENRSDLEARFSKHVDAFDDSVVATASSTEKVTLLEMEFEANVSARAKVLEQLNKDDNEPVRAAKAKMEPETETALMATSAVEDLSAPTTTNNKEAERNRNAENENEENVKAEETKIKKEKQREELKKLEKSVTDKLKGRKESNKQKETERNKNQED